MHCVVLWSLQTHSNLTVHFFIALTRVDVCVIVVAVNRAIRGAVNLHLEWERGRTLHLSTFPFEWWFDIKRWTIFAINSVISCRHEYSEGSNAAEMFSRMLLLNTFPSKHYSVWHFVKMISYRRSKVKVIGFGSSQFIPKKVMNLSDIKGGDQPIRIPNEQKYSWNWDDCCNNGIHIIHTASWTRKKTTLNLTTLNTHNKLLESADQAYAYICAINKARGNYIRQSHLYVLQNKIK